MFPEVKMTYNPKNYTYDGLIVAMEFWKDITDEMVPGIKPIYKISSLGNVYNVKTSKYFNLNTKKFRYMRVTLTLLDNTQVHVDLHRLVCMAFHGMPIYPYNVVDHINCDKKCNYAGNLEWVTKEENYRRALLNGLMSKPKT